MNSFRKGFSLFILLMLSYSTISHADGYNYDTNSKVADFINQMQTKHNFDASKLKELFIDVKHRSRIIELMTSPAEAKAWKDYRPILVTKKRVKQGVAFLEKYRDALQKAEQVYGVPPEIIVSIIGVETRYGRITGSYRVMDALATLAFDYPKRSAFFSKELAEFLILAREEKLNPLALKGSYAGAMGYGQFMPSSYRHYAIDFDEDGHRDIWNNPVDAIGSVANYFSKHGWVKNAPVTLAAKVSGELYLPMLVKTRRDLLPKYKLKELVKAGFSPVEPASLDENQKVIAIKLTAADADEHWIGLHNFYVITRYNHSSLYAMAVYQLSQKIAIAAKL